MPKLELAVSIRAATRLPVCQLARLPPPPTILLLYVAYLRYRSLIQSRDSRVRYISRRAANFRPEVRSGLAQEQEWIAGYRGKSSFFSRELTGNRSRLALPASYPPPSSPLPPPLPPSPWWWSDGARLHKYYANIWSNPVTTRARTVTLLPRPLRHAAGLRRKVSLLISTEICTTRVSPLSLAKIACTLHTRHNSTPNPPLQVPSPPLILLLSFYLSFSPIAPYRPSPPLYRSLHRASYPTRSLIATHPLATSSPLHQDPPRHFCAVRSTVERAPSFGTWKRAEVRGGGGVDR